MRRTAGLAAWSLRMASRAWASAEAVTVQVLTTMMSAPAGVEAEVQPRSSNWRSRAAPSACVARQPNCSMKKRGIGIAELKQKNILHRVRGVHRERREEKIPCVPKANSSRGAACCAPTRIAVLEECEKIDSNQDRY